MSCGKRWKWHFQDSKLKNFSGGACPQTPLGQATFGDTTFLSRVPTPSKSHATSTLNSSCKTVKTLSSQLCFQSHTTLLWYVTRPSHRLSRQGARWAQDETKIKACPLIIKILDFSVLLPMLRSDRLTYY